MKEITDADSDVVDVAYKAMNGEIRVMPWTDVDPLAVADGRPWREFPWYLGQRHYRPLVPGLPTAGALRCHLYPPMNDFRCRGPVYGVRLLASSRTTPGRVSRIVVDSS
jgi:hypothetical protein